MGGRGASSGSSEYGNKYGSQYHCLYQYRNIKYVTKNTRQSEALMETMTNGRVYAVIGGNKVMHIIYFDKDNKRSKQIDLVPPAHNGILPHTHRGYFHNEDDEKEANLNLTSKETKMVERVLKIWDNRKNQ